MEKKVSRIRRITRSRIKMRELGVPRLQVHRTLSHIYANVIVHEEIGCKIVASASTLDKQLRDQVKGNKTEIAKFIGTAVAKRAKAAGVTKVAFDRSGFKYHGRIRALADAAREAGLEF